MHVFVFCKEFHDLIGPAMGNGDLHLPNHGAVVAGRRSWINTARQSHTIRTLRLACPATSM